MKERDRLIEYLTKGPCGLPEELTIEDSPIPTGTVEIPLTPRKRAEITRALRQQEGGFTKDLEKRNGPTQIEGDNVPSAAIKEASEKRVQEFRGKATSKKYVR